jgi:hypothetical protein
MSTISPIDLLPLLFSPIEDLERSISEIVDPLSNQNDYSTAKGNIRCTVQ